jgi:hypothetical protein
MKLHIFNYEQALGIDAILTKYSRMMQRELMDLGHDVTVSAKPEKADINHHINFISYKPSGGKDTVMITHLTGDKNHSEKEKIKIALKCLKTAFGICMNEGLVRKLIANGADEKKLDFVYHAHDGMLRRPRIIAMVYNIYPDGRQRPEMFERLFKSLKNKKSMLFRIMGKNWTPILKPLAKKGLQIQYTDQFTMDLYQQFLNTSDYLLFTGDEDSLAQSIVDATNAGLRVISPPQDGIDVEYPFNNQQELNDIFDKFQDNPVKEWTWANYSKSHEKIWKNILK